MIGVVVLGVVVLGVVHSAAQCKVNAKRLPKWPIYIVKKHLFSIVSQALAKGTHCNSAVSTMTSLLC